MNVGIVIVSHSPLVAEGVADMVRQMVGDEVRLAWCGGDPAGGEAPDTPANAQGRVAGNGRLRLQVVDDD